jgi:predicted GNAT family acetyltransferase
MDFLRRIGRFIGGAAQNVGRAFQQAPQVVSRAVLDAERARQQAVAQVQRNLPRFQAPPPPRIQLPQIQIPRVQLPQAPKVDFGAVSRALSNYYGRTAASQVVPGIQRAIPQIDKNVQSFNERLLGGLGRTAIRTAEFVLPGKTENISEAAIRRLFPEAGSAAGRRGLTPLADPRSFGGRLGTGAKAAVDVAGIVLPSTAATKGLQATQLAQRVMQGGRLARLGTIAATEAVGGIPASLASIAQARGQQKPVDLKKEIGIGLAIDAATPLGIKLLGKGYKAIKGALSNVPGAVIEDAAKGIRGIKPQQAIQQAVIAAVPIAKTTRPVATTTKVAQAAPIPRPIAENVYPIKPGVGRVKPPAGSVVDATPGLAERAQTQFAKSKKLPGEVATAGLNSKFLLSDPRNGNIQKYILDAKGNPVGGIIGFYEGPNRAILNNVYVLPGQRGKGAASKMIKAFEEEAKINGVSEIKLTSKADKLYEKLGYKINPNYEPSSIKTNYIKTIQPPKPVLPVRPQQAINNVPQVPQKPIFETVPSSAMQPKAPKGESTLADIQISTKPVVPKEPISAKAQEVKSQFLNRFDSIERFVRKIELERGTKLKPSENPMYYVKQFMGGGGIANYRIDNELTPMLKQTKNFDGLRQYLVARRMNELASRGIGKKANAAIAELTQKYGPDEIANFDRISTQLYQYQRNQLDQLLATGVISKQSYDNIIAKNQFYIPFNRVIPDVISDVTQSGQKISGAKKLASLKAIKGSEKDIIDPIESVIKNTYDVQATVAKQKVLNSLVALAPDEFKPLAKGAGLKAPAIELFADGKRVKLAADPELAKALNSMDEEQLNLVIRAMSLPAKTLRAGATSLNVAFALPNVLRDQLSAAVNSKYGGIPMYDFVSGLASVIKKDDSYKKWILSGADQATLFAQDRTTLQRGVKDITGGLGFKAGKLVKSPLELFRIFGDLSEKGSRVGVFKRALKGAGKEGLNAEDALLTAMRESREATIDFAQRGSKMKAFNAMVPFLNARVQGTYKLIQSFKNRPVQTMMRGAAIASAPAAILFIHNNAEGNAEVYNEIPDYVKREYFVIVTGDEKTPFIKIPKGEVGKIFANPVESFMAAVKNDNPNWSDTAKSIADSFLPVGSISEPARFITDIGPTAVTVPYQVLSNYDAFRDEEIVSKYQKDLPAAQQYSKYNTETAKKLGELLNISPAQLEFALSGFTGGLGRQGLQVADIAQGQKPPVQELPVLSRFLGQEKDLSASAQEVYKQAEKAKQQKARENFAIKEALRKGDTSVLEGLDKAAATRLKRTVEEEKIKENLNPLEKSLFSLSKDQLETMKNSEYKDSVEKVIALQESLKSKSNKERVPKIKKTLPKQKRWGKKGRKAKVAKVKIPRPRKVSVTGVPKTPKITLAKVSTKGIKPKATARKSIKIKTG